MLYETARFSLIVWLAGARSNALLKYQIALPNSLLFNAARPSSLYLWTRGSSCADDTGKIDKKAINVISRDSFFIVISIAE